VKGSEGMERLTEYIEETPTVYGCGKNCKHDYKYCKYKKDDCPTLDDIIVKLAEYEDMEEQGRLIKLPCNIGDDIYFIPSKVNFKLNVLNNNQNFNRVYHQKIARIVFSNSKIMGSQGWSVQCDENLDCGIEKAFLDIELGETWFLSEDKAQQALEKLESEAMNETN
jgi:hypothetical protein